MKFQTSLTGAARWPAAVFLALIFFGGAARAGDLKFEAVLVWATSAEKSPDPKHKPVDAEVQKKLRTLPLKWSHFFEVNRAGLDVPARGTGAATLSEKCRIEVVAVNETHFEVSLIGKGEPVIKRTQSLARNELLVLGGNAPDDTGWLVVLKRVE